MRERIPEMLDEEIEKTIEFIKECEEGSEDQEKAIEKLTQLHKLRSEEAKMKQAAIATYDDGAAKRAEVKSKSKDRIINTALQLLVLVGGWAFSSYWLRTGYIFEESGTVRSPITRNLMNKVTPKR